MVKENLSCYSNYDDKRDPEVAQALEELRGKILAALDRIPFAGEDERVFEKDCLAAVLNAPPRSLTIMLCDADNEVNCITAEIGGEDCERGQLYFCTIVQHRLEEKVAQVRDFPWRAVRLHIRSESLPPHLAQKEKLH